MTVLSTVFLHMVFFGFLTAWVAERRGYGARAWFALGLLLGGIATFLLLLQPKRSSDHGSATPTR